MLWASLPLALSLALPLAPDGAWKALSYSKLPPNQVTFVDGKILVAVRRSSSPLFYRFSEATKVAGVEAEGRLSGLPEIPPGKEGERGGDDFALRLGVVLAGNQSLSWFQKLFAPQWLRFLADAMKQPFGGVEFSTVAQTLAVGHRRRHPQSEYLQEEVALTMNQPGLFHLKRMFPQPIESIGLWIQADGDDTESSFDLTLEKLSLITP